ncbi:MAG: FAD-dependent oxidoreductase [Planctomycetes bacterium]|nr:FAD-dependent oxidoreductase [Planctomycetota bacterium]
MPAATQRADVIVLGGGLGGVAATLAACGAGHSVILTEETDWLGGQATSQGVSALDENRYIEQSGGTRSYLDFRHRIRQWYRRHTALTGEAHADPMLDPGNSWVSRLTFEPKAAVAAIDEMLTPHRDSGRLVVLYRHRIIAAGRTGRRTIPGASIDEQLSRLGSSLPVFVCRNCGRETELRLCHLRRSRVR